MADRVELGSVVYRILFETADAEKATQRVQSAFNDLDKTTKNTGKSMRNIQSDTKVAGSALDDVSKKTVKASNTMAQFRGALLQGIGIGTGFTLVTKGVQLVTGAIKGAFDASVRFESAFAGVKKTVEASEGEYQILAQQIRNLSKEIPIAVDELARIGELGGQLGVGKADLEEFIETIAKIAVTTNLTEEEAATSFARIANIMGEPISEIEKMGSVLVELGNNFATTEREITEFATRIAGAGKVVGLQVEDVFALATALSSVGIEAEAGGTAIQKALLQINDAVVQGSSSLQDFATLAGVSAQEFADQWRTDPIEAFDALIQGLGTAGDQASSIIDDLIGSDVRLKRAFLSISNNADLLTDAIGRAKTESTELNALTEEAAKRFETTESKTQLYRNRLNDLGITIGDNLKGPYAKLLEFLASFLEVINDMVPVVIAFGRTVGAVFVTLRNIIGSVITATILLVIGFVKDFNQSANAIKEIIRGIATIFGQLPSLFGAVLQDIASSFAKTFKNIQDRVPAIAAGITAIQGALNFVGKGFSKLVDIVKGWARSVTNVVQSVREKFVQFGTAAKEALAGNIEKAKESIISSFSDVRNEAQEASGDVGDEIRDSFQKAEDETKGIFSRMKDSVSDVLDIDTSRTRAALDNLGNSFKEVGNAADNIGFDNTKKAFQQVGNVGKNAGQEIVDAWKNVGDAFKIDTRQQLLENETKRVEKQAQEMQDAINSAFEGLGKAGDGAGSGTSEVFKKQLDDLKLLGDEIDKNIDIYARISDSYLTIEERAQRATDLQTNKWQEVFTALTNSEAKLEDVDNVYNTALSDIASELSTLEKNHYAVNTAIDDLIGSTEDYQDTAADNQLVLDSYEQIQDAIEQATNKVKSLKSEIQGIDDELEQNAETFKQSIANKVADAEQRIASLRDQLQGGDISVDRRSDIDQQIREQEALIESSRKLNIDFTEELARAREEANLNEIELLARKFEEEKARLEEQRKLKEEQLQAELDTLTTIKEQENNIYDQQKNHILAIEDIVTTAYRTNMKARLSATQEFVQGSIELYNQLAAAAKAAQEAGANLSTGAIQAARFQGIDLNDLKTSKEQQINNITQNITVNAEVGNDLDIQNLASQLSNLLKEEIAQ